MDCIINDNESLDDLEQKSHIQHFSRQIKESNYNLSGNMVILSDCLLLLANELASYLERTTNLNNIKKKIAI